MDKAGGLQISAFFYCLFERQCQVLDRDGIMSRCAALQASRPASLALHGLGRQRRTARWPHAGTRLDTCGILQAEFASGIAKRGVISGTGIGQHDTVRSTALPCSAQLPNRDLRFGRKLDFRARAKTSGLCA